MGHEILSLDLKGIHEYQQNRKPYLMIDGAEEVIPGLSARGFKQLTKDDWFFAVHWPDDPNMPGLLQIEAMVQMCALSILTLPGNKGSRVYLSAVNNVKFKKKIVIGDRLDLKTTLITWKRGLATCRGEGSVKGETACRADFSLVLPEEFEKYRR